MNYPCSPKRKTDKEIICPHCNGKTVIKYGRYKNAQLYYCKECHKRFVEKGLKYKTYSPQVILAAVTEYNLGNTLEAAARSVNRRFKVKTSKSSVHAWVHQFADICTYAKLRAAVVKRYTGKPTYAFSFYHSGLTYTFQYHLPKLEVLCTRYPALIQYLKTMHSAYPPHFFKDDERCSQLMIDVAITRHERYNQACKLAELAVQTCARAGERHAAVEQFMLINDSSTVACEIPVWFWDKQLDRGICGHIDMVQIRQGKVFVLDYKPAASQEKEEKVASQLYLYASGLSLRTKIPLRLFRCAWFDDTVYYEFEPAQSMVKPSH